MKNNKGKFDVRIDRWNYDPVSFDEIEVHSHIEHSDSDKKHKEKIARKEDLGTVEIGKQHKKGN